MGAARAATYQVYKAANNLALGPTIFNKMRQDDVNVVSDSWGLCEVLVPPKLTLTENTSLELLAAGGSSFYVASGDSGSADCKSASPAFRFLAIDDPSSQPFATAVGGTNLKTSAGPETAWSGSGGGVSYNWPRPGYQADRDLEPEREHPRGVLRRRHAQVPRDARCRNGRGPGARLPHLQPRPRRGRRQLGGRRRDERGRAAHGGDHGRRKPGGRHRPGLREPVHLQLERHRPGPRRLHRHQEREQQQRHRLALAGHQRLRHGDRARLGQGRGVRASRSPGTRRR